LLEINQLKPHCSFPLYTYDSKTFSTIVRLLRKSRAKVIGVNLCSVTASEFIKLRKMLKKEMPQLKFVDVSLLFLKLRSIKTQEEVALYKRAANLTERIWDNTLRKILSHSLKTELSVKDHIESQVKLLGLTTSFPTIVASGKDASIPHYMPQHKKLAKGFCYVDFGINYKGYCTDITRTICIGKPSLAQKKIYDLIFSTKTYAESLITTKTTTGRVTEKTRKFLGKYEPLFNHGLGHGIGLEIHELPNLKSKAKDRFFPGMMFTIEQGIYKKGKFGIRIEDDYLLAEKGLVRLTKAPKDLVIIT